MARTRWNECCARVKESERLPRIICVARSHGGLTSSNRRAMSPRDVEPSPEEVEAAPQAAAPARSQSPMPHHDARPRTRMASAAVTESPDLLRHGSKQSCALCSPQWRVDQTTLPATAAAATVGISRVAWGPAPMPTRATDGLPALWSGWCQRPAECRRPCRSTCSASPASRQPGQRHPQVRRARPRRWACAPAVSLGPVQRPDSARSARTRRSSRHGRSCRRLLRRCLQSLQAQTRGRSPACQDDGPLPIHRSTAPDSCRPGM